jgi:hypothetical protein
VDVEDLRSLGDRGPLAYQTLCQGDAIGRELRGATEANATGLGCHATGTGAFPDQFALELRDAREDRQHHPSARRRGIRPRFVKRPQAGFRLLQLLGDLQQTTCRSGQPVETRHDHHITGTKLIEHPSQFRTTAPRARGFLLVDPLAADILERRALPGEILVLGRDAGVADEHGGIALLRMSSRNILLLRATFATQERRVSPGSRRCRRS